MDDSIRISAEIDDAEITYKNIREKKYLKKYLGQNHQIFTMALLIGKYVVKERKPLKDKKDVIRLETVINKHEINIFKCIAIEETDDINCINDSKVILEICEEYANSGIKELKKWVSDKDEFETQLCKLLINFFEDNKNIYLKYQ